MAFPYIKWRFIWAAAASGTLIALHALEWSIIERITPFLYVVLDGAVWFFFLSAGVASLTCLRQYKQLGIRSLVPFGLVGVGLLVTIFFPFTKLWLDIDFVRYKSVRDEIVRKVQSGALAPNVKNNPRLIVLGKDYPLVSMGGNEIVVEEHDGGKYVFFFTFRGILDNYAGFLHIPEGGSLKRFSDFGDVESTQVFPLEGDWVFVSQR